MGAYEILTLAGLFTGPVAAVVITLWYQAFDSVRSRQLSTFRMMLNTRHLTGDPSYSSAVNLIPVEFNRQPRVMKAWEAYIQAVRYRATPENQEAHQQDMLTRQTKLIHEIAQHLGYKLAETDIQTSAYAAQAWMDREKLNISAQVAWVRIADALERQNTEAGIPVIDAATLTSSQAPQLPQEG